MAVRTFYFKVVTRLDEHDLNLSLPEMKLSLLLLFYAFVSVLPGILFFYFFYFFAHDIDCMYVLGSGEKLVGFSSDCICDASESAKAGTWIIQESNSAGQCWQTSGCFKDAPGWNLSRLMEWGAESRDPPARETKEETFYMSGKGRAVACVCVCSHVYVQQ